MTAIVQPGMPVEGAATGGDGDKPSADSRLSAAADWLERLSGPGRILAALVGALILFGLIMVLKGTNPFTAYSDMVASSFGSWDSLGSILVRATPIILAALAVAVPARA